MPYLYHIIYFISFVFKPWIRAGLQNPYGCGNSQVCLRKALPDSVQQPYVQQTSTYADQRLLMQFQAPDDGQCVAQNMLSFI